MPTLNRLSSLPIFGFLCMSLTGPSHEAGGDYQLSAWR